MARPKSGRKEEILQALARELEGNPGSRITTAALAKAVGVSEAALYRHFPGKAEMFEALIDFAEEAVFGLINRIMAQSISPYEQCMRVTRVMLGFSENNPGITRILLGDALVGESARLRARAGRFFDRVETQLKQSLREALLADGVKPAVSVNGVADQLMAFVTGKLSRFVRSEFKRRPLAHWDEQWEGLSRGLFRFPP